MKKVLLAIAAVATITSCSQNEEFENPSQQAEIKIGTTAVTRATVMETNDFRTFRAFGYAFDSSSEYELLQQELKFLMELLIVQMGNHGA